MNWEKATVRRIGETQVNVLERIVVEMSYCTYRRRQDTLVSDVTHVTVTCLV